MTILWLCIYSYHLYSHTENIVPYFTGCKGAPPAAPCQGKEMNTHVKSVRLNPPYQGCYRPVRALVSATLESTVSKKKLVFSCHMSLAHPFNYSQLKKTTQPHGEKVVLKFSGDGTAFSSTSSFVFLSFSFPTLAPDALAASGITIALNLPSFQCIGNHTYASARGHETYEFLRDCFAPVWREVAALIDNPVVVANGREYTLDIVCGSDYKVRMYHLLILNMAQ